MERRADRSTKLILKFDIDKVASFVRLKSAVAKILRVKASTLQILSIEKGCVVVTLFIPAVVADTIFVHGKNFTPEDY